MAIRRHSRGEREGNLVEEAMLWRCFVSFLNRERQKSGRRVCHAQQTPGKPYLHRPWKYSASYKTSTQRRLRIAMIRKCLAKRAPTPAGANKARCVIVLASSTLTGPPVCTILSGQLPMSCNVGEATSGLL